MPTRFFGFATWFCRASGERAYFQRMQALMQANSAIYAGFGVTPALLRLDPLVPSGLLFLQHGRGSGGSGREARGGVPTHYKSYVRQAIRWMENHRVFLDYNNTEVDCVSSPGVREMYAPLTDELAQKLCVPRIASTLACLHLLPTWLISLLESSRTRIPHGVLW